MRFWLRRHYTVPACALAVLLALLGAHVVRGGGWVEAWSMLRVTALSPTFADLRTITHSLDAVRHGLNPYVDVIFDPWHRVYNYPSIWLSLAYLGIGSQHTNIIGAMMIIMLVISLTILFDCGSFITRALTAALVVSPPMLLLVERGNGDMLVFSMLALGFMATRRWPPLAQSAGRTLLIALLTAMKIYPFVAVAALIRNRQSMLLAIAAAVLALAALLMTSGVENLRYVFANTPQIFSGSYGASPLFQALGGNLGHNSVELRRIASAASIVAALLFAALAFARRAKDARWLPTFDPEAARDQVALACLAIFLFSFVLGSNFDYRLIFLIGTVPPMLRAFDLSGRRILLAWPIAVVAFLWLSRVSSLVMACDEVLGWGLFCAGVFALTKVLAARLGLGASATAG